ncbi:MAG: small ribosomal subunit Rsm22 family protein [Pseudolabrys sp.]
MTGLPAWLGVALDRKLDHVSRADLRARALAQSEAYRAGGASDIVRSDADALAYAVVRMPATFAAVRAALSWTAEIVPDFAPRSLIDLGAGPGTATWAALEAWPSLRDARLIDRNAPLLALARRLYDAGAPRALSLAAQAGDVAARADAPPADVVLASYAFTELVPAALPAALAQAWRLSEKLLVIVEPGTASGFRRILQCRGLLLGQGAAILAPCSHESACPLADDARWCHFGVRLPRTRDHLLSKGASVPFEDEKFVYLAAAKGLGAVARGSRVLATPKVGKTGVTLTLCAPDAVEERTIARREKNAYVAAKRLGWGDALPE